MSPAIPSPVSAGPAAPPRRSQQNSPPSTSRSVPGPSPASSRISTTGCASTTSASRQDPAQTATSSFSISPSSTPNSPNAACRSSASIPKSAKLIGNFKNQGTTWERSPQAVNDHDFRSQADGIAIPYGVYDLCANRGFVVVGTSHDTPDFAADNLIRWWQRDGLERYRDASELLVLADSGGSNAPRIRCFKYALQTRLADPHHLKVTVCHYPSGASKWNPIDHRLFSEISKNWAGHPLRSYQTILNHIRTTTTDTGLCVTAQLVDQEYPKGVKISDAQFASIALQPHQVQPLRNYTICPRP